MMINFNNYLKESISLIHTETGEEIKELDYDVWKFLKNSYKYINEAIKDNIYIHPKLRLFLKNKNILMKFFNNLREIIEDDIDIENFAEKLEEKSENVKGSSSNKLSYAVEEFSDELFEFAKLITKKSESSDILSQININIQRKIIKSNPSLIKYLKSNIKEIQKLAISAIKDIDKDILNPELKEKYKYLLTPSQTGIFSDE